MSSVWVKVCEVDDIDRADVMRFDLGERTFAVYRTSDNRFFATDGLCTHGRVHLAEGFVDGTTIECSKHNGRFDFTTGAAKCTPVKVDLGCYAVGVVDGVVHLAIEE